MPPRARSADLPLRQVQCLTLAARGVKNREIARRLGIKASTVKYHLRLAYAALGAVDRTNAVHLAQGLGLLADAPDDGTPATVG